MELIGQLLGNGAHTLNWYQAGLRAIIIYVATLLMVRIGEKRFLGKNTAFDIIVGVILGSMVSSAINTTDVILPSIVAGFVLVGMHWLFAFITYKSDYLDTFLKGGSHKLVENGEVLWGVMKDNALTKEDLLQELRTVGHTEDVKTIRLAYYERSGDISVLKYDPPPKVVEVKVEAGVQTVRIVMDP